MSTDTDIDEVYVAHIKSMFDHFDDEIIWTAIYEQGYNSQGEFNIEKVINYLLELSGNTIQKGKHIDDVQLEVEDEVEDEEDDKDNLSDNTITNIINAIPNLFSFGNPEYTPLNQDIDNNKK